MHTTPQQRINDARRTAGIIYEDVTPIVQQSWFNPEYIEHSKGVTSALPKHKCTHSIPGASAELHHEDRGTRDLVLHLINSNTTMRQNNER
jgi:hypothetical protein